MKSYIPFGYLADFLEYLGRHRDIFEVLTYRDLPWGEDWDYAAGYPAESAAWDESLRSGRRDASKVYLLLQHDVDSLPERTLAALRVEERLGLRSNVMIFNRRVDRRHYREAGELRYTEYPADHAYLQALESKGFVIGYHCNAYERSGFSRPEAERVMLEDIDQLGRTFALGFMSAHGGHRGPDGKSNNSLDLPPAARRRIRWVHNGHGIRVDGGFTDGGMNSGRRAGQDFDLRPFMRSLRPGRRYRILLHPQYYGDEVEANPHLRSPWYDEVLEAYGRSPRRNVWEKVRPGFLRGWVRSVLRGRARRA